ncbi:MAG: hypothetical protein COB04_17885 [Gammaproteobacteria bacterium]|nr:MAG: hypothetical protein COB04_17885 [Gammaproteobacteria bacterium]
MIKHSIFSITLLLASSTLLAGQASVTPFNGGETATASSVNASFNALITAINDNDARIAVLEAAATNDDVGDRTYLLSQMGTILRGDGELSFTTVGTTSQSFTLGISSNGSFNLAGVENEAELNIASPSINTFLSPVNVNETGTWTQSGPSVTLTFTDLSTVTFQTSLNGRVLIANDFSIGFDGPTTERGESSIIIGVEVGQ